MSKGRTNSSPDLTPLATNLDNCDPSLILQGLAANVKLLLKLIEDHNEACTKDFDDRKMQRVASMITILDEVKTRIQKSQNFGIKKREAALRRCNTELRANRGSSPNRRLLHEPSTDEKETLKRELNACTMAGKSLERMFLGLGKEKEIMAAELARKTHELNAIEEHVNDLKVQNESLLAKLQACAVEHKGRNQSGEGDHHNITKEDNVDLEKRNKTLSENLIKSLDGYRSLKRRLREAHEEKERVNEKMEKMSQAEIGLNRIVGLQQSIAELKENSPVKIEYELSALEDIFRCFKTSKITNNGANKCDKSLKNNYG